MKEQKEYYEVGEIFNRGWVRLQCIEDTSMGATECNKCFFYNENKSTCTSDSIPRCYDRKDKKFVHFEEV